MKLNLVPSLRSVERRIRTSPPDEIEAKLGNTGESEPTFQRHSQPVPAMEDSAECSNTERQPGEGDEAMSVRRLRSALTRQLSRITITPAEPETPGEQSPLSAPPNLDRNSVEAQEGDVFGSSPTAARAMGQKRGAQEDPFLELDSPASPGRKLRKLVARRPEDTRNAPANDTPLGTSAPW